MSRALFEYFESLWCHPPRGPTVNRLSPHCSKAGSWRCGYESAQLSMQRWAVPWCVNCEKTPAAAEALAECYEDGSFSHPLTEVVLDCCHHCQHRGSPKIRASFAFSAEGAKTHVAVNLARLSDVMSLSSRDLGNRARYQVRSFRAVFLQGCSLNLRQRAGSLHHFPQTEMSSETGVEWYLEPQHLQWDTCEKMVTLSSCQDPNALEARICTTRGDRTLPMNSLKKQPCPLCAGILPIPIDSLWSGEVQLPSLPAT